MSEEGKYYSKKIKVLNNDDDSLESKSYTDEDGNVIFSKKDKKKNILKKLEEEKAVYVSKNGKVIFGYSDDGEWITNQVSDPLALYNQIKDFILSKKNSIHLMHVLKQMKVSAHSFSHLDPLHQDHVKKILLQNKSRIFYNLIQNDVDESINNPKMDYKKRVAVMRILGDKGDAEQSELLECYQVDKNQYNGNGVSSCSISSSMMTPDTDQ